MTVASIVAIMLFSVGCSSDETAPTDDGNGDSGYTLTGVVADFFAVAGATSVSNDADTGVVTAVFPATWAYAKDDTGPAGGLIFYIDEANQYDWTYLEAGPVPTEVQKPWGDRDTRIGPGYGYTAAQHCGYLIHGGYDDWFLPSKDELDHMYTNIHAHDLGNFLEGSGGNYYWSSSERTDIQAWVQDFFSGNQTNFTKANYEKQRLHRVRPIRAF